MLCIDLVLRLTNDYLGDDLNPPNVLLLGLFSNNHRLVNENFIKGYYPNLDKSKNIYYSFEEKFLCEDAIDPNDGLMYSFSLFKKFLLENGIQMIYMTKDTISIYRFEEFQEFLIQQ